MKLKSLFFASAMLMMVSNSVHAEMSASQKLDCYDAKKKISMEAFNSLRSQLMGASIEVWCPAVMSILKGSASLETPVKEVPVRLEQNQEVEGGSEGAA